MIGRTALFATLGALTLAAAGCGDNGGGTGPDEIRMADASIDAPDTAPETTITSGAMGEVTIGMQLTYEFTTDTGVRFECRVDGAVFSRCSSPFSITALAGMHTLEVRAVDADADYDPTPASRTYNGIGGGGGTRVRLMAGNLTSGNLQAYEAPGTRIFQGLKPDIAMIQEFNVGDNATATVRAWVDMAFGASFFYFRESGAQIPNGIVSRYPILASGIWQDAQSPNREFAYARIDVPGTKDLWAISVHLLTDGSRRPAEATELVGYINANVPAGDYLAIGGDFNTSSRTETAVNTLGQVVGVAAPFPVDQAGDGDTNANRNSPYDWVMIDADLLARQVPVTIGTASFTNGLVFDSRVYTPLSAVAPVLMSDSAATNMQHMGVVKDVMLQ
ncbi:MAG TPA: endonuclease/exonuclease/phosphatase family protein [Kofleriaceae bacterium]|nr:endonuclease/exonuclease/phosphatase family protein [Kofleriaceae bacterium]